MPAIIKEFDAKVDSKKRITLRGALYEYYHVQVLDNGSIILEPRELTVPSQFSDAKSQENESDNVVSPQKN